MHKVPDAGPAHTTRISLNSVLTHQVIKTHYAVHGIAGNINLFLDNFRLLDEL